ncbi:MAG: bacillithiol biosynthesis BshC [Promethearchaeota archaeon]
MKEDSSSLLEIYRKAALGHPSKLSKDLWGEIPTSYRGLKKLTRNRQEIIDFTSFSENIEVLRSLVTEHHRKMGTLTLKVRDALNHLEHGFLDVGHQPLLFGGPLFLINKISLAEWVGSLLNVGTFFFIGDHDSIQNELTIARFPQAKSPSGLEITQSSWGVPDRTPMHQVPLPKEEWFLEIKPKIQENLRALMKVAKVKVEYRQLLLERFYSWFDLIYDAVNLAEDFSTWTQRIWSQLFNIRNNLGIFINPISEHQYRQLLVPAFEFLLTEKNRTRYVETLNSVYDLLVSKNIQPGLPYRDKDYVPFFLECLKCKTKTRVELRVETAGILKGKCQVCSEEFNLSYNTNNPDLSEIGSDITPRSDSRAVVNNFTFPLLVHIGGSGETQYYSAVLPAMKRLKISSPILIRSNRVYYNTPWGEKTSQTENPILDSEVYSIFNEFNKNIDENSIRDTLEKMRVLLHLKYKREIDQLDKHQVELENNPQNNQLRKMIKRTELILSHNFGRFAPGKDAQEVSWNWLDLSVLTGIHGICDIFQRQLKEEAFPGYTWYITAGKFS